MKKILTAVAVAASLAFAGASNAALFCKNDLGQTLTWKSGDPKPVLIVYSAYNYRLPPGFDVSAKRDVVCFLNSYLLTTVTPAEVIGIPYINGIASSGPDGDGIVYRGDQAKWLIENLPAVSGLPATKEDYNVARP
jgi:hypothetical protein